jgi:CO/xanthine dehydrogenase Mo-binding subunit
MPKSQDLRRTVVEKPCAWGPFGAKGFSETPMTALVPAMANATYNAIGVRIPDFSLAPDNILKALEGLHA